MSDQRNLPWHRYSKQGRLFTLNALTTTIAGAAHVLYLANDAGQADLVIPHIHVTTDTTGVFTLFVVTGTAAGGTEPVANATRIGETALADITTRTHTAITGLSTGVVISQLRRGAGSDPDLIAPEHGLILPAGLALSVHFDTAADVEAQFIIAR